MRARGRFGILALVLIGTTTAAPRQGEAARLVKVDEQFVRELPPEPGVIGSDPCTGFFSFLLEGNSDGRTAFARSRSESSVLGVAADCSPSISITLGGTLTYILQPDAGEAPGQSVALCVQARQDVRANSVAPYQALANAGGSPFTTPATVTRFPGMDVLLSSGPLGIVDNGTDTGNALEQVTVKIGDTIELRVGTRTLTAGMGVGSSAARANSELFVSVGSCARSGAPTASAAALLGLALGLGGLGSLSLAWRRRRA